MPKPKQFEELHSYLKDGMYDRALVLIEQWHPVYLALFQKKYPQHKETFKDESFSDFWHKKREGIRLPDNSEFRFRHQTVLNDFNFVQGYSFYLLCLKSKELKQEEEYKSYLQDAIEHSSMYAVRTLLHELIKQPITKPRDYCDALAQALSSLEPFAIQHGTPGYLLIAKGYFQLVLATTDKEVEARQGVAFKFLFKYLHMSRLAETESESEIYNAYFGEGIALGNPFKISSIENILAKCREMASNTVPILVQNFIKNEAIRDYEVHRSKRNVPTILAPSSSM